MATFFGFKDGVDQLEGRRKGFQPFFTSAAVSVAKKTFSLLFDFEVSFPGLNLRNHFFAKKIDQRFVPRCT